MNDNTQYLTEVKVSDLEIGMMLGGHSEIVGFCDDTNIYGNPQRGLLVRYQGTTIPQRLPYNETVLVG